MNDWDPSTSKLGDWFLSIADYLKVYTPYVNNYHDAHFCLKALEQNKDLALWLYVRIPSSDSPLESEDVFGIPSRIG